MTPRSSLAELLADPGSSAPAIVSISPLVVVSYKALAGQIERLSGQLRGARLKSGDSVAIVLPNSLEFLVVFLVLTHARLVATPLNPADKADEIRFFVADAQARALVAEGANIFVKEADAGLSLPVWQPRVDARGVVELPELTQGSRTSLDTPHPDDVALFAYTSGTTGRPKVFGVPNPKYGEEVSSAVVLRGVATAQELQAYCRTQLADFNVPKLIHMVSAIPRNAMGKLQRSHLAALFS
jgi:acyl-CoA synthetase (AMP-forming)/AMP-acid ligase II